MTNEVTNLISVAFAALMLAAFVDSVDAIVNAWHWVKRNPLMSAAHACVPLTLLTAYMAGDLAYSYETIGHGLRPDLCAAAVLMLVLLNGAVYAMALGDANEADLG